MSYPVILRVMSKKCVIIGGGAVASRKATALLEVGADITIVSPSITKSIQYLVDKELITYHRKSYSKEDIQDAFLIIAATNQFQVNDRVREDASNHQLLNIVDNPEQSNFFVPASLHRGKLTISISTQGASPSLTKKIKKELATIYDEPYENYIEFLYECRERVKNEVVDRKERKKILKELLNPLFLDLTRKGELRKRDQEFLCLLNNDIGKSYEN